MKHNEAYHYIWLHQNGGALRGWSSRPGGEAYDDDDNNKQDNDELANRNSGLAEVDAR